MVMNDNKLQFNEDHSEGSHLLKLKNMDKCYDEDSAMTYFKEVKKCKIEAAKVTIQVTDAPTTEEPTTEAPLNDYTGNDFLTVYDTDGEDGGCNMFAENPDENCL